MESGLEIVAVEDLKLGMFVAEPDCPWIELPFFLQGFVLSDQSEIETFAKHCRFVYIDRAFSIGEHFREHFNERDARPKFQPVRNDVDSDPMAAELERRQLKRQRFLRYLYEQDDNEEAVALSQELKYIEPTFENFQVSLHKTLNNLQVEDKIDVATLSGRLGELSDSLNRNPDAVMWLMRLKRADESSFDQAVDVSVYLLLLGKHIGLTGDRLVKLSMAGMLQDVGKTTLPQDLLAKTTELLEDERELIRSHVASSLEILCLQNALPNDVLMTIANHHERWDGSGYPRGLAGNQIGRNAEMAGLIDSFCAMTRSRPYRAALGHQQALEALYTLKDKQFNSALLEQLVQCVGLYPIGSLLELNTGEVGVVIQQNRVQRARPRVLILLDQMKLRVREYRVIDLREPRRKEYYVLRALPQDAYGLNSEEHYFAA